MRLKPKCEPVTDFVADHFSAIFYTTTTVVVGGLALYAIGFCKGTQFGRNEWTLVVRTENSLY